jgi:hypothetical protein
LEPNNEPTEAEARLEEALERIARLAARRPVAAADGAEGGAHVPEEVTERLDALIARLRTALGSDGH